MILRRIMTYFLILVALLLAIYAAMWLASQKTYPIEFGVSFNQDHAASLGLNWRSVYEDMLRELRPKHVRIAAMWSDIEAVRGRFDFSDVDWMMDRAAAYDIDVLLVVGQKAPRWPECHVPDWFTDGEEPSREYILTYVERVVERYKDHPALDLWQVENEPFIRFRFGDCKNFHEDAVADEIALVRELDPDHRILVTDSGELSTWRKAIRAGDVFGTTMYRVVQTPKGKTVTYDWLPAALYRWKARAWGKEPRDVFISELQAEPWFTRSDPTNTPIAVQEKTMNPERMEKHIDFAARTGFSRAYFWGVEWWYFMKQVNGDDQYWNIAKKYLKE